MYFFSGREFPVTSLFDDKAVHTLHIFIILVNYIEDRKRNFRLQSIKRLSAEKVTSLKTIKVSEQVLNPGIMPIPESRDFDKFSNPEILGLKRRDSWILKS